MVNVLSLSNSEIKECEDEMLRALHIKHAINSLNLTGDALDAKWDLQEKINRRMAELVVRLNKLIK